MPELAEVEYNRKQWQEGLNHRVLRVHLHADKRVFRGTDTNALKSGLREALYLASEAHGKRMLFRFSKGCWVGLHLGMTGHLHTKAPSFRPGKHDHLVLVQENQQLVFTDPRAFGRVQFHRGEELPTWWQKLPPSVSNPGFTVDRMKRFLARHRRLAIKAALLSQEGFPGIGNWMADEILWRSKIQPARPVEDLTAREVAKLWSAVRWVSQQALAVIGKDYSDPPAGWLFHERWAAGGRCPLHEEELERAVVGGRTTAWCRRCQNHKTRRGQP